MAFKQWRYESIVLGRMLDLRNRFTRVSWGWKSTCAIYRQQQQQHLLWKAAAASRQLGWQILLGSILALLSRLIRAIGLRPDLFSRIWRPCSPSAGSRRTQLPSSRRWALIDFVWEGGGAEKAQAFDLCWLYWTHLIFSLFLFSRKFSVREGLIWQSLELISLCGKLRHFFYVIVGFMLILFV